MPVQKPGRSKQDYQTPPELLMAVQMRLCAPLVWDLAATRDNAVTGRFYSLEDGDDALQCPWAKDVYDVCGGHEGWAWLNPPFADIEPWAKKCTEQAAKGLNIAMLIPASVGANWWRYFVEPFAYALHLNPRVKFVGEAQGYPKDCSLLLYTPARLTGSQVWRWT
jgi:DNA (cytosine-5)-methyltransferase 1